MKKFTMYIAIILLLLMQLCGCSNAENIKTNISDDKTETFIFTDSCGREVSLPKNITKIAPSGSVAQMILYAIADDLLVGLSSTPSIEQMKYFPDDFLYLPTFGQFYGSKANMNMESLIAAAPDVIIDVGDMKETHREDMDSIQAQTGIPTIFVEAHLETFADAYRTLGKLLNREKQAEELAAYIEEKVTMAKTNSAKISADDRITVMFGTGASGLDCNAKGSVQADVIELVGAENAVVVEDVSNKGGGNSINMEQLYNFDPDVIIFDAAGAYDMVFEDIAWKQLKAVQDKKVYEIPNMPYNWMANPPSVNRVLGISWLGNLLYPEIYDYDMVLEAQKYYKLFWHYELSKTEAEKMLSKSTLLN